jgi:hypothetical protein
MNPVKSSATGPRWNDSQLRFFDRSNASIDRAYTCDEFLTPSPQRRGQQLRIQVLRHFHDHAVLEPVHEAVLVVVPHAGFRHGVAARLHDDVRVVRDHAKRARFVAVGESRAQDAEEVGEDGGFAAIGAGPAGLAALECSERRTIAGTPLRATDELRDIRRQIYLLRELLHRDLTDDPLSIDVTVLKATHLNQLRAAVDALRFAAGLTPAFAGVPGASGVIRAADVTGLIAPLDRRACGVGLPALQL